ncbi:MAG: HlyD family efflux transporter periplasmic adaptor subunit [Phycisphaerae bacterium]|nr:HlyD family efflux transporter periplasmic adaptor subunit [Phycisphaerae bacterium]
MSSSSKTEPSAKQAKSAGRDPYAEILTAASTCSSQQRFFTDVLGIITRAFNSPYAAIYVARASEVIQESSHTGPTDPDFWKAGLEDFLTESLAKPSARGKLYNPKHGGTKAAFLSSPILDDAGQAVGALALVDTPIEPDDLPLRLAMLESLTALASHIAPTIGRESKKASSPGLVMPDASLADVSGITKPEQLAFAVTNNLRNRLGCEQVAIGLVKGNAVKILSISGLDDVASQTPGIAPLLAAMEECLDADTPIVSQRNDDEDDERHPGQYRLHGQWRSAASGDAVASIPLHAGGRTVAILSARQSSDQSFTQERIEKIRAQVEPFAPVLVLSRRAARGLLRHAAESVAHVARVLTGHGRHTTKLVTALVAAATLWLAFGKMDYELTVPCTVVPRQIRHVSMPFDGVLASTDVVPGDRVKRGDVLCAMDKEDLTEQRAELLAEIAVLEHELNKALAEDKPVDVQLSRARRKLLETQLDILDNRIQQAVVRAPIDGIVVAGDLRRAVGSVIPKGQPLLEVAPLDDLTLELKTPEGEVDDLAVDQSGEFSPSARPEESYAFRIERIRPSAELHQNKNVYVAEAQTDLDIDWIRPGMEGTSKVHVGKRRVWWVVFHRVVDSVRLRLGL